MPMTSQHPRVLHVDGDTKAKTLTAILRIYGHDAVHVYTASEALVWCRLNWPDVVIVDVTTDPSDAVQLADLIVTNQPACKVLLLAGPGATTPTLPNHSNLTDYAFPALAKPVDPQKILDFLATCPARARTVPHALDK